jgi:hypothetical protein
MLMGGGGLRFEPEKGDGVALGAGAGSGAGVGAVVAGEGALGGPPGEDRAGATDPVAGAEYTGGAPPGIAGPTPIVGIMP